MPLLSVIMPVHNASDSVVRAILSVERTSRNREIEIIVVDDCSSDDTYAVVETLQREYDNIQLYRMPSNTGGPSAPRNFGIERASGEYITFLDDDDWYDVHNLMKIVDTAKENDNDFIKGYLVVVNGQRYQEMNRIENPPTDLDALRKMFIQKTSTTQDFVVKRSILIDNDLRYNPSLRIGEDTLLVLSLLTCCENIAYIDLFYLFYDKSTSSSQHLSSTQKCDDEEVNNQITVWEMAEEICKKVSLSYYQLRLNSGLQFLLMNIVQRSNGISLEVFQRLCDFCRLTQGVSQEQLVVHPRFMELYEAILEGNYNGYLAVARRRLLIAGYDLKFVEPLVPYLEKMYVVRIDEWTGHASHDQEKSRKAVKWADIIWCEWLLQNAVWYSKQVKPFQRLVIRAHRFELWREFGQKIDYRRVSCVITVGYYYFEQFQQKFAIPRDKMRLLPNYVEETLYSQEKNKAARYTIGLVGIIPARKGFLRSLQLLKQLRKSDERFQLRVMGLRPQEVPWVMKDSREAAYFKSCNKYITQNGLDNAVVYGGQVSRSELYGEIGYVLSLSDEEAPESFHLAPAEGAAAGSMGLLMRWPGVEYLYPEYVVFDSLEEIATEVLAASKDELYFRNKADALREFVCANYSLERFLARLNSFLNQL